VTDFALDRLRSRFHRDLCRLALGFRTGTADAPTIADRSSAVSTAIAQSILRQIPFPACAIPPSGQRAGTVFAECARDFLREALDLFAHLTPSTFHLSTTQAKVGIGAYAQYRHLSELQSLVVETPGLRSWLGTDYLVTPDLVVFRMPYSDEQLNACGQAVGPGSSGGLSPARFSLGDPDTPILHASVSCKWTIRSDRAQNSRLEGLNLLRNRKGRAPHICSLTFEPLPSRIESVAAGTGDIDCVYHAALLELEVATEEYGTPSERESLQAMLEGRRLRDISDLPLDLLL